MGRATEMLLERHSMLRDGISQSRYRIQAVITHWRAPLVSIRGSHLFPHCISVLSHSNASKHNSTQKRTLQPLLDGYIIGLET